MKKTLLVVAFAFFGATAFAQSGSGFGLKAGLSYNKNGDLINSVGDGGADIIEGAKGKAGYHIGVFGKLDFTTIYLRPELVYSKTKSEYEVDGDSQDYDVSKLDMPVLLGLKVIGPLHVFAGPAFQYTLKNELGDLEIDDVENDFTVGLNIGAGVNLGRLGLDVRYERGFSKNEAEFIGENITDVSGRVDSRPSQVIFALSLML
ncbi:outer membrane beta-barrel protein [Flagellimonas zhangzhouensis]|uniref:Outer membrane protein beta-barrel domain-containing protein n=1 Tax=Flagellimonas zhangzhouensis TaxID=1073328 RepID=A0A1H2Z6D3_9FLAO|nr:outer membrane beta-barrel protein [Allomuricauda zhangzhouensis]SDR07139.1 Outer membrane protein beta-barrel domain-containing protein [Allomuricauda zhangzhouensis]SDX12895.1 Outer membrane protein beta-barrel domain-containing protein [Allomuricauda zhangzhouensis]